MGVAAERVDHLLGSPPRWGVPIRMLAATFLTAFAVLFGIVLFILPGLYIMGRLSLTLPLVIDRGMAPTGMIHEPCTRRNEFMLSNLLTRLGG